MPKQMSLDLEDEDEDDKSVDNDYKDVKPGIGRQSKEIASFWMRQISLHDKEYDLFQERGDAILTRFTDKRSKLEQNSTRRMNVLWSNVKILKPALFSSCPIPNIDRKFLDRDPKGRLSAQILERSVRNEVDSNGLYDSISAAVDDYLLPGRGIVWVRYEPVFGLGASIPAPEHTEIQSAIDKILKIDTKPYETEELEEEAENDNDPEEISEEDTNDVEVEQLQTTGEQLLAESVPVDYINWKDFYCFPVDARTWAEVQAIGKRVWVSKREAITRFGEEIGKELRPDTGRKNDSMMGIRSNRYEEMNTRNICIYEIWNKADKKVYWVNEDYNYLCDIKDDPLNLVKFFPCPKPIYATLTNENLIPVADYTEYQDQAIQIDELTTRIAHLTKACKVIGTYDASNPVIGTLLDNTEENKLVPVDQWAIFAEKGGVPGAMSFVPLDQVISVIQELTNARSVALQDLDLITGITDIQRGTTDSRETLGGIRLKNNTTGSRLQERQNEIAEFAKETVEIITEIVSRHFSDKALIESSGILYEEEFQPDAIIAEYKAKIEGDKPDAPPMPPMGMPGMFPPMGPPPIPPVEILIEQKLTPALKLIRDNVKMSYRIDIETDSTIYGDAVQERQDASQFVEVVSKYIGGVGQMVEKMPEALPLFGAMLRFAVRKYRTGRDLESSIDTFVQQMENKAKKMAKEGPPPDPKIQSEQLKQQGEKQRQQFELQKAQQDAQTQAANDARDAQKQQQEDERTYQLQASEDARESAQAQANAQIEMEKADLQNKIANLQAQIQITELEAQARYDKQQHDFKMEELRVQHEMKLEQIRAKPEKKETSE